MRNSKDYKLAGCMCSVMGELTMNLMALVSEGETRDLLRARKQAVVGHLKMLIQMVELYAQDE